MVYQGPSFMEVLKQCIMCLACVKGLKQCTGTYLYCTYWSTKDWAVWQYSTVPISFWSIKDWGVWRSVDCIVYTCLNGLRKTEPWGEECTSRPYGISALPYMVYQGLGWVEKCRWCTYWAIRICVTGMPVVWSIQNYALSRTIDCVPVCMFYQELYCVETCGLCTCLYGLFKTLLCGELQYRLCTCLYGTKV
jgi:hypothetical protein